MNLPRSSFYYTLKGKEQSQPRGIEHRIEALCLEFPRYGYRRITAQLHREGWKMNHKKVLKIMRTNQLLCRPQRRWIRTTQSDHRYPLYPNLLRECDVTTLNQAWGADITYIRIFSSFVYLAVLLDLFSRKIIGYAISRSLQNQFTLEALRMALSQRNPLEDVSITRIKGFSMLLSSMLNFSRSMGFGSAWHVEGTPMTTPLPRVSSRP